MYCDVAIVGGGASGLALAALLSRRTKLNICVLEGGVRLGKKLAASGNGQGNVSNVHMSEKNYYGGGAARGFEIISRCSTSFSPAMSVTECTPQADRRLRFPTV